MSNRSVIRKYGLSVAVSLLFCASFSSAHGQEQKTEWAKIYLRYVDVKAIAYDLGMKVIMPEADEKALPYDLKVPVYVPTNGYGKRLEQWSIFGRASSMLPDGIQVGPFAYERDNSILMKGTPEAIKEMREILAFFDIPAKQFEIQATVEITLTDHRGRKFPAQFTVNERVTSNHLMTLTLLDGNVGASAASAFLEGNSSLSILLHPLGAGSVALAYQWKLDCKLRAPISLRRNVKNALTVPDDKTITLHTSSASIGPDSVQITLKLKPRLLPPPASEPSPPKERQP